MRVGIVCLAAVLALPLRAFADSAESAAAITFDLYKKGRYESVASRGLSELLSQPWNHKLRLIVADSLQRIGKTDQAKTQLEALEGTAYAQASKARLAALQRVEPAGTSTGIENAAKRPESQANDTRPGIALHQLPQFRYLSPGEMAPANQQGQSPQPTAGSVASLSSGQQRSAAAQRIVELAAAENYQEVGSQGLALLAQEKPDEELRLMIANSLAWTGRLDQSISIYQGLLDSRLAPQASIGLANAQRWRGRADQALPLYQTVLAQDPANADAQEGLRLVQRELRPRTTVTFGNSADSAKVKRLALTVNHRWRDSNLANSFEIETNGVRDTQIASEARQQDLTVRYNAPSLVLKPSVELSIPNHADNTLYGGARLRVGENNNLIEFGRVNWGKMATNPDALRASLSAVHLGLEASQSYSLGTVTGRMNFYDISDGNEILSAGVRFASSWRPLGNKVKPFAGVEMRHAKFNTPRYWSPQEGFGTLYGGLVTEWSAADWHFNASGQVGMRLYGDAGTSWSLSAGGKRWIANDLGIGFGLWNMASQRDNASYRANSANVSLEKLW